MKHGNICEVHRLISQVGTSLCSIFCGTIMCIYAYFSEVFLWKVLELFMHGN